MVTHMVAYNYESIVSYSTKAVIEKLFFFSYIQLHKPGEQKAENFSENI